MQAFLLISYLQVWVPYIQKHYKGAKIVEAGKIIDPLCKHMFEAEIKGKDMIFDEKGVSIKED